MKLLYNLKFLCVMANTILKQVNDVGEQLGYPFYVYPDGTCGKSIVSGKMNAIGIVKKKFPVKELKSKFLSDAFESEEILAHLSQIGENIGFPFYVYADGTCGTTVRSRSERVPFVMWVKQKFLAEYLLLDAELAENVRAKRKSLQNTDSTVKYRCTIIRPKIPLSVLSQMRDTSSSDLVNQMRTWSDDAIIEHIQNYFCDMYMGAFFAFSCSDKVLKAYVQRSSLCDIAQKYLITMHGEEVIRLYIEQHCLCDEAQLLMIEKCSYELLLDYIVRHPLCAKAQRLMIDERCDDIVQKYMDNHPLCCSIQCGWLENCNDDKVRPYINKHLDKYKFCEDAQLLLLTNGNDDLVRTYIAKYSFFYKAQNMMLEKSSDDIINVYFEKYDLCDEAQNLLVEKCSAGVIKAYFEKYQLCENAQKLMVEKCGDDVVKAYLERYQLCDEAQKLMIEKSHDDVVKAYRKKYGLDSSVWGVMRKRYGFFWFLHV